MNKFIKTALNNPVAGNLILFVVILVGYITFTNIQRETFPEFNLDMIRISVIYRGATPDEIEESIVTKIEEKLSGVEGIDEINSTSSENMGSIIVKIDENYNAMKVKDDIEKEIDQILTFPTEAEKPVIVEIVRKKHAIYLGLYGDVDKETLKKTAENIEDELLATGDFSQIEITGLKEREISIELSEEKLQKYNLSFQKVSDILKRESINMPGGTIKSDQGEITVRTSQRKYTGEELGKIPVITTNTGVSIKLADIAKITDSFEDVNKFSMLNGKNAALITIDKTASQDLIKLCEKAKEYVEKKKHDLPAGMEITTWGDSSEMVLDRLTMLTKNGIMGLSLVFIFLCLFMELKLAFWVALGIPFSFMGTFMVMSALGVTINMISMFALIIVLGIVVDDAMVVSESIHTKLKSGMDPFTAAFKGTMTVFWPIIASVSTTVVAFVPFFFVDGMMGKFMSVLPTAVISVLLFSLFESLFILPAHLAHSAEGKKIKFKLLKKLQDYCQSKLDILIHVVYPKFLSIVLDFRYISLATALSILIITLGLISGGIVKFNFFPKTDQDILMVKLEFPTGTDAHYTLEKMLFIEKSLYEVEKEMKNEKKMKDDFSFIKNVQLQVGNEHSGRGLLIVELESQEKRDIFYMDIIEKWRKKCGQIPDSLNIVFSGMQMGPGGKAIELRIAANSFEELFIVREKIKNKMAEYPFLTDIEDDFSDGKLEARLKLKPLARTLGFKTLDVAMQVKKSYFGDEPLRIQRDRDDIRVYVRYPKNIRDSLNSLNKLQIRNAAGEELPFSQIASFEFQRGFSNINHAMRKKAIIFQADIDERVANDTQFRNEFTKDVLVPLRKQYPGVTMEFWGRAKDMAESIGSLLRGLLMALLVIYAILATIFGAYIQPIIIMMAIPLGFVGAVVGHVLMGFDLTMLSLFGLVALAGIVVNNSLLLIEFTNRKLDSTDLSIKEACIMAGRERFLAIFLTTSTTFLGVTPMLLETSRQAVFLQPMVVSLGFGVLIAAIFTLFIIPALYMALNDVMCIIKKITGINFKQRCNVLSENED